MTSRVSSWLYGLLVIGTVSLAGLGCDGGGARAQERVAAKEAARLSAPAVVTPPQSERAAAPSLSGGPAMGKIDRWFDTAIGEIGDLDIPAI